MGLLSFLSEQKKKAINVLRWKDYIKEYSNDIEMDFIIQDFFIKDDIDIDKFMDNIKAEEIVREHGSIEYYIWGLQLSMYYDGKPIVIDCSPTYKQYYTSKDTRNVPLQCLDWFLAAYPDVVLWITKNWDYIENIVSQNEDSYIDIDNNRMKLDFYKITVKLYKNKNKLECSI